MDDHINIGKFVAAFGLTGELVLKHAFGKKTTFKEGEVLFIEQLKGSYLPYFIQTSKSKTKEETYVKLEGIDSREKALKLIQKNVWLRQEDFRNFVAKNSPLGLLGYTLIDEGKTIGKIEGNRATAPGFIANKYRRQRSINTTSRRNFSEHRSQEK